MAEAEAKRAPTPTNGQPPTVNSSAGHEAKFVKPSDYLRPRAPSRPIPLAPPATPAPPRAERPIDRDERLALVSWTSLQFLHALVGDANKLPPRKFARSTTEGQSADIVAFDIYRKQSASS